MKKKSRRYDIEKFEFPSKISSLKKFYKVFERFKRCFDISDDDYDRLFLASSEAFMNAIIHGNKFDPWKKVYVKVKVYKTFYEVEIEDEGEGFEPESLPNPTDDENLLKESGRGVYLMRAIADTVKFQKTSRGMKVKIKIKKRPSA
jgi:serine/threonine-protein kinase RsbW